MNRTKIKGGCQSGRKVVPHNSKSDLPLEQFFSCFLMLPFDEKKNKERGKATLMSSSLVAKQGNERALDDVLSQNFSLLSPVYFSSVFWP